MAFDYTSVGFFTFDCLGRPVNAIPPGGDTYFIDEMALAVSGAAGSAAIVAAKHGLSVQAVGGVGHDDMGDWVIQHLNTFGVDTNNMERVANFATSSSIVTTRPDGARPALHRKGATGGFYVTDEQIDSVLDTRILHIGGVGLMDAMDGGRTTELMQEAKKRGCITTLDVFAATQKDFKLVEPLLPYTDYFMPSEEEAMALSGLANFDHVIDLLLEKGTKAVVLTLGPRGAMYRDRDGLSFDIPAYDVDVVCTCGCGDCFNAGFATGLHLGMEPQDCVRIAQASSAQNAMGLGSQAVVKSLESTQIFMAKTMTKC
ncbi:MAG: sugar kinase [Rhodobacteraceae bacterium]|nr:sugar kinase [Paracoccaceae bacterium]MCY4196936.1 sugar kinase [Paracoccaceae bacterium]MCY4327858.1 sugar kinase [Paracoccaceae bacterium]